MHQLRFWNILLQIFCAVMHKFLTNLDKHGFDIPLLSQNCNVFHVPFKWLENTFDFISWQCYYFIQFWLLTIYSFIYLFNYWGMVILSRMNTKSKFLALWPWNTLNLPPVWKTMQSTDFIRHFYFNNFLFSFLSNFCNQKGKSTGPLIHNGFNHLNSPQYQGTLTVLDKYVT